MELLQNGVDRAVIALWLGHESVETTSMYLHADLRLKQAAMAKTNPTQEPPERFCPEDHVLEFLDSLWLFRVTCRTKREARLALAISSEY